MVRGCDVHAGLSVGKTIVLLGKMQLQVDRLVESPGGAWDTVVSLGEIACALRTASARHPGAFVTPSMPGIVKIGATTRELADRLREANESDTWRPPEPYVAACAARVTDAFAAERSLHTRLAERRVSSHREFFRLTVDETRAVFRGLTPG